MRRARWDSSATPDRGRGLRLENLALVPASLLPHKATYQRLADQLPAGAVLVVLPTEETAEKHTLQTAAARLLAKGHPVTTLSADDLLARVPRRRRRPAPLATPAAAAPLALPALPAPPVLPTPTTALAAEATPDVADVPPFTRELRLVSIDASRNRARFYLLQWQPTLWGTVMLVRVWGRLGGRGRSQVVLETDVPQLDAALTRLVRQRRRHGYQLVDWH